jgi:hypothetical protein
MQYLEDALAAIAMAVAVIYFRFQVAAYNRKYRLSHSDQERLFFYLFMGSDAGKLLRSRPDMMRKEFPRTVAAMEAFPRMEA